MSHQNMENEQAAPAASQPQNEEENPMLVEPKMPTRKDTSLKEFLAKMDDYAPIVSNPLPISRIFKVY